MPEQASPIAATFAAAAPVLAWIDHGPGAAAVLAAAARLAMLAQTGWHAVLVETPRTRRPDEGVRLATLELLRQAQGQGAVISVLEGVDSAALVAGYARRHGCATAVLARTPHVEWRRAPPERRLAHAAPGLHQVLVAVDAAPQSAATAENGAGIPALPPAGKGRYLMAVGASLLAALVGVPLLPVLDLANVAMLFLLTVVLVALRLGRGPAIAATLLAFGVLLAAAPRRAFGAGEFKYAVALGVMLAVAWIAARLTSDLRDQAESAIGREERTRSLYEFARALSSVLQTEQVFEVTRRFVERCFDARCVILLPGDDGRLAWPEPGTAALSILDMAAAQWAYDHGAPAGAGTATLPSNGYLYLPLLAPMRTRGVLAVRAEAAARRRDLLLPERRALLDAYAALAAIALERVHYVEVAQDAQVAIEGERLRNSLLSALSHDLRTPLTSLVGLSESLTMSRPPLAGGQLELANALRDEARRMSTLVANLLDMARIQSGGVRLNLQWQMIEELVGSALRAARWQLGARSVETRIPVGLPLVRCDAVLLERVLCNLLENAGKYTPPDACIEIAAETSADGFVLRVCDNGPGLPPGREDALFEKFVRGQQESPIAGVGLGLAICRAIVEAHGGRMRAHNLAAADGAGPCGACFEIVLPLAEPPPLPDLDAIPLDDHLHAPGTPHDEHQP